MKKCFAMILAQSQVPAAQTAPKLPLDEEWIGVKRSLADAVADKIISKMMALARKLPSKGSKST